jgi:hypothetical protein
MQRVGQWRDHVLQRRAFTGSDHHVRLHSRDEFLAGAIVFLKFLIELYDLQPGFVHSIGSRRQIKPRQIMILN